MNKQLDPNKFTEFLSTGARPIVQPRRTTSSILADHIEEINRYAEDNIGFNTTSERDRLIFRFNDLTPDARAKMADMLKKDSSLYTVRETRLDAVIDRLTLANPIVASNWRNRFVYGSFNRWRELTLSRVVYYLGQNYRGDDAQLRTLAYLLNR